MRTLVSALILLLCVATATQAAPVSYQFAGTFTTAADTSGAFGIVAGDTFSGSFTYDTALTAISSGPSDVVYQKPAPVAPLAFDVTVNSVNYSIDNNVALNLQMSNNAGGLHDQFSFWATPGPLVHPLSGSYPNSTMSLSLRDSTDAIFSSPAIPATLDLNDFDLAMFAMNFDQIIPLSGESAIFLGQITSLTSVPEPSTLFLLGLASLGSSNLCRRR